MKLVALLASLRSPHGSCSTGSLGNADSFHRSDGGIQVEVDDTFVGGPARFMHADKRKPALLRFLPYFRGFLFV